MKKLLFTVLIGAMLLSMALPRQKIFVIGDSISIHYHEYLQDYISAKFDYDRKRDDGGVRAEDNLDDPHGANGGDSRMVLDYIRRMKSNGRLRVDYLMVNCGLHDVKTEVATGKIQIPIEQYSKNLDSIYHETKSAGVKLIWVTSTPVNEEVHNTKGLAFNRYTKDVEAYNQVAEDFFSQRNIPIIDLGAFSKGFPASAYLDHVHYKPEYRKLQAAYIAGFLMNM